MGKHRRHVVEEFFYIRENNKWLLKAGENVQINPRAQQFDSVKQCREKSNVNSPWMVYVKSLNCLQSY